MPFRGLWIFKTPDCGKKIGGDLLSAGNTRDHSVGEADNGFPGPPDRSLIDTDLIRAAGLGDVNRSVLDDDVVRPPVPAFNGKLGVFI